MKQTTEKDNYIGRRLDGRYLVEELIGVGGMAYVYKATDLKDNSTVAVKILKEELLDNEELVRRFKNESRAISMLDHENIVKVLDVNFSDSVQYIVMEYLNGITLKEYIQAHTSLTWKETVYFSEQLLRALQHAHDRGIIHRDMKPQNVMLLRSGKIKVMDFGIARFSRSGMHTITDKAIGTVHYISPEQAKGEETNTQSDIYSVGVMMYEMCTGKLPFDSQSAVTVALKQISDTPKSPREINPTIPEGLEDIILKAMEKDTAKRYPSAGSMLMDIENFKMNPSIRFEYKYLSSENPTVYLDHAKDTEVVEEAPVELEKEAEMAKDKTPTRGAAISSASRSSAKVKKKRPRTINLPIAILMGITAACLIGAGILVYMTLNLSGSQLFANHVDVVLPDFVGKQLRSIQSNADYSGFTFEVVEEYNTDYTAGTVFSQTPAPPKEVKDNAKITLYVSKGTQVVTVPDIVGDTYGNAVKELQALGLVVVRETDNTSEYNGNTITKVEPNPGASVESGTEVTIYVNTPNRISSQYVPNVVGMPLGTAKGALMANGLRVGTITEVPAAEPAGTVIGQGIGAGARVATGSYVTLTVSSGITDQERVFNIALPATNAAGKTPFNWTINLNGASASGSSNGGGNASIKKTGNADESGELIVDGLVYKRFTVSYQTGEVHVTYTNSAFSGNHKHVLVHHDATASTSCTSTGTIEHWSCSECGKTFSDAAGTTEITNVSDGKYGSHVATHIAAVAPTCTENGNIDYFKCSVCGKCFPDAHADPASEISESSTVVPATGHTWGEWTVTKPATETEEGIESRSCSVCGATETRPIPKTGG